MKVYVAFSLVLLSHLSIGLLSSAWHITYGGIKPLHTLFPILLSSLPNMALHRERHILTKTTAMMWVQALCIIPYEGEVAIVILVFLF